MGGTFVSFRLECKKIGSRFKSLEIWELCIEQMGKVQWDPSKYRSSTLMLFNYLALLQNDSIVTSGCMQFTFGDKGEVYLQDKSALPVTELSHR